jgi:hypothetical protein
MRSSLTSTGLAGEYGKEKYYQYTGSKTEGTITMKISDRSMTVPIEETDAPSPMLSVTEDTPKTEPLTESPFASSYEDAIFRGMVEMSDPGIAVRLLFDYQPGYDFHYDAESQFDCEGGQEAIPFLIEEVKRGRRVYYLLEHITWETFGDYPEVWVSRWEAQQ